MIGYTSMLTLASLNLIKYIKIVYPPHVIQVFKNNANLPISSLFPYLRNLYNLNETIPD